MPDRRRKTPVKPAATPGGPAEAHAPTLADLMERGDRIRKASGQLVRWMRDLAAELAEAEARAEDWASDSAGEEAGLTAEAPAGPAVNLSKGSSRPLRTAACRRRRTARGA